MRNKFFLAFLLSALNVFFVQGQSVPKILQLQSWLEEKSFCLSSSNELEHIWGEPASIQAVYIDEMLPAFFRRRISFKKLQLNKSKIKWIFTGLQGSITVSLSTDSVELSQRYYNSFGFNKMENDAFVTKRYPQSEFTNSKKYLNSISISSITLEVNHTVGLRLFVNDNIAIEQLTQIDVSKHQLQAEGLNMDVCGRVELPASEEVHLSLFSNKKYQKILGFGGITSPVAYSMLSENGKKKWWYFLKEYNLLIQREYPVGKKLDTSLSNWDNLLQATPHYYGDNFPNGEVSDFRYNKKIQELGGMVVFEFWHFPDWVINQSTKKEEKREGVPDLDKYADAIVNYCIAAKRKTGKPPAIVGIQNEITQPDHIWEKMTTNLRKRLDDNGFAEVKIHMHNPVTLGKGINALSAFSREEKVWSTIDYTASNLYDYQSYFTNPDSYDKVTSRWTDSLKRKSVKPFLSVEMCVNDATYQSGSYKIAFLMGELYHKNMVDLNAVSLMYCWLLINTVQPSFAASRSLFTIDEGNSNIPIASSYQLRVFGAFSRHLVKGFQRMAITSSDTDLLASAYVKGNKEVIILLNKGFAAKKIKMNTFAGRFKQLEIVSPYKQNEISKLSLHGELVIEPGSIITLF